MISSTSSSDPASRAGQASHAGPSVHRHRLTRANDQISLGTAVKLGEELAKQPEVRADVVARAEALAADPSYPTPEIMRRVSEMILGSPDLSEDES